MQETKWFLQKIRLQENSHEQEEHMNCVLELEAGAVLGDDVIGGRWME